MPGERITVDIYEFVSENVYAKDCIAIALDPHLNYLAANHHACAQLMVSESDLLGRSILDLYPGVIASRNHRNLLRAAWGETIRDELIVVDGRAFNCNYHPLVVEMSVVAIIATALPAN